ncbi:23S rRNA (adenine(1618)-N(6))-methyltransferase RlmF [Myroides odoratimimus]|uniref:23S rRNA (adenine(1618)-N(6))-methyltransferase RlmF n=1 Tax=Myroides odoratimimus TaxID=76832 RepID=UPI003101A53D
MKDGKKTTKKLHERNKHQNLYNFEQLKQVVPELATFIIKNPSGVDTIDFAIPEAVVLLNKAILMKDYKMTYWEMPKTNLCPPIPGRADYIHYIADLLAEGNNGKVPTGRGVKVLDLGIGANVIYPIIGVAEYGWEFVGSEVDVVSVKTASHIIDNNPHLKTHVIIRQQPTKRNILKNIIGEKEYFDVVICNPPFFKSRAEVLAKTTQKLKNLGKEVVGKPVQNFSGQNNELWCDGGELAFITNYIYESKHFKRQAVWFTTLVSNKDNLKPLQSLLKRSETKEVRIINMEQGNKISRILAWRY